MKYKKGDIVTIKSFEWWEKNEEILNNKPTMSFPKSMALNFCNKKVKILEIFIKNRLKYDYKVHPLDGENITHSSYYICEEWIENGKREINIPLKKMKSEV